MEDKTANRRRRLILIPATLLSAWLGMQVVHEFGHIVTAKLTGGRVERTVLPPLGFSRTDLAINPHPLVVAWGGPLLGVLIPLIAYGLERLFQLEDAFVFRFYAGFCLVANGAYLGFGSFIGAGDAGDIVRLGSPIWTLWIFGTVCMPLGLWMWHKQGAFFGIGRSAQPIPPRAVLETVGGCVVLLVLGAVIGWS